MMKTIGIVCVAIMVAVSALTGAARAGDEAMVADVQGDGVKYASGERTGETVEPADFLNAGDRIEIPAGSKLVVNYFQTGVREEISGPAALTVGQGNSAKEGEGEMKSETVTFKPGLPKIGAEDSGHRGGGHHARHGAAEGRIQGNTQTLNQTGRRSGARPRRHF